MSRTRKGSKGPGWEPWSNRDEKQSASADSRAELPDLDPMPHSKSEQRRLGALRGTEFVEGIECPHCLQNIWSRHRHDFRYCFCRYCYVDGGRDYTRVGYGGPDWPEPWQHPLSVLIEVPSSELEMSNRTHPRWAY